MGKFSFTAAADCDRCGALLSSSSDQCSKCDHISEQRYHFINMTDRHIQIVWAISPIRAWAKLLDKVDNTIPWALYETKATSLHYKQMGYDVTDKAQLKEPSVAYG